MITTPVAAPAHQFVAGQRRRGRADSTVPVVDPATGQTVVDADLASSADVDDAVTAAREAYRSWSRTTPAERSTVLHALARELEAVADELVVTESRQTGKPHRLAREFDVPGTIDNTVFFAGIARQLEGQAAGEYSGDHTSYVRSEPVGVVGSIAPWNYPLQMAAWKILPAIAAGNAIVLKPAEQTPLTALLLAEACHDAGIPDGVVNVVTGSGAEAGQALAAHPDVAMVSFTGSTKAGRHVMETAARGPKRTHLELGGKAPFLVFDDADLTAAVQGAVAGALINTGQDCTAATRAYVQRPLYEEFVDGVVETMRTVRLGDPADASTDQGPLISLAQRERVAGFVDRGRDAGAKVLCGGRAPQGPLARGSYYLPTVVVGAAQDAELVQEEIFGPVLVVLPFDGDDDGLTLSNDTPYGLAASVWTTNVYRSLRATAELRTGCVWVNDHIPIISEMPHGGRGASGFGKDMSAYSFEEYTHVKHVMLDRTAVAHKPWHRTVFGADPEEAPHDRARNGRASR